MLRRMTGRRSAATVLLVIAFVAFQRLAAGQSNGRTLEVSTEELTTILSSRSATVLDARPRGEFAKEDL